MKQQLTFAAFCVVLFLLGCKEQATSIPAAADPVTVGPFTVNSDTGLADGQAFGVNFKAMRASSAEVQFTLNGNPQYSSSSKITLAEDLSIELETMSDGNSIVFQLNGKKVCDVKKGDKVAIDEDRNVTVNGEVPSK